MTFRKTFFALTMVAALFSGCAKSSTSGKNDAAKRYFDAWLLTHYPDAKRVEPGIYIIEDEPGSGVSISDMETYPYIRAYYTSKDLQGNVKKTSVESLAKQLGTYSESSYYGPYVYFRGLDYLGEKNLEAGMEALLSTMKVGGKRTVIVPGWLATYSRYDTEEEYLANVSGTDCIYTIEVTDAIPDIQKWEIAEAENYMAKTYHNIPDSTGLGFYYLKIKDCVDTTSFKNGDKVYLNYTGRMLNGKVFDTTIADTAKVHGIYNPSNTYEPTFVTWGDKYEELTMGTSNSDVIDGFKKTIYGMKVGEKGAGVFISDRGYGYSGSSSAIPPYAPLVFEIEITKKD